MAKIHINGKGEPKPCRALVSCPFGDDDSHYGSVEEAQAAYDKEMSTTGDWTFRKETTSDQGERVSIAVSAKSHAMTIAFNSVKDVNARRSLVTSAQRILDEKQFTKRGPIYLEFDDSEAYREARFEPTPRVAHLIRAKEAKAIKRWARAIVES